MGSKCNDDGIKTLSFLKLQSPHYYYAKPSNISLGSEHLKGKNSVIIDNIYRGIKFYIYVPIYFQRTTSYLCTK